MRLLALLPIFAIASTAFAADIDCKALDEPLNTLATADQQIRIEGQAQWHNSHATEQEKDYLQQRWRQIDAANLIALKEIVATCGWPATKTASHAAWLLVQHADSDIPFQQQARALLETAVQRGIGAPRDLAYLADRIATNQGRPQEYGTQFTQSDRCHLEMLPVDSVEQVNRRRLAIGLSSLQEYEAEGRRLMIPDDCPAG